MGKKKFFWSFGGRMTKQMTEESLCDMQNSMSLFALMLTF